MQSIGELRHLLAIDEYSNGTIGIGLLLKGEKQAVHASLCDMVDDIVEQLFLRIVQLTETLLQFL